MKNERTISCEYIYAEIDYGPLARLLAERFMELKNEKVIKDKKEAVKSI